jgi:hypothetical protein
MTPETNASVQARRDASVEQYILALDAADFETVSAVLAEAMTDPTLAQMLQEVDAALHAEADLPTPQEQATTVRRLLRQHLPSAFIEPETGPPTVGDVAARLQAEHAAGRQPLLAGDLSTNGELLGNRFELTGRPSQRMTRQVAEATGIKASDHYWERFRRAAVALLMARDPGAIQLAAARRRTLTRMPDRVTSLLPPPRPEEES